jgi:hypothetical protein
MSKLRCSFCDKGSAEVLVLIQDAAETLTPPAAS